MKKFFAIIQAIFSQNYVIISVNGKKVNCISSTESRKHFSALEDAMNFIINDGNTFWESQEENNLN